MKFTFFRPLFFILIFSISTASFIYSKPLLASPFQLDLVTTYAPPQNYNSLIQHGRVEAAIGSVLQTQILLSKFYKNNDNNLCDSCRDNIYFLELQRFFYLQAHKELQALANSLRAFSQVDTKLKSEYENDINQLESILVGFEPNFESSSDASRIISNSVYFGVTQIFLDKILSRLKRHYNSMAANAVAATAEDEANESYILHSLVIRNLSRLLVLKSSTSENNNITNFTDVEISESLDHWRILGHQIHQLIEPIVSIKSPTFSTEGQEDILELQKIVTNYTHSLLSLRDQLKQTLDSSREESNQRMSLERLLNVLKSIADESHRSSLIIDANIIIAEFTCDSLLRERH